VKTHFHINGCRVEARFGNKQQQGIPERRDSRHVFALGFVNLIALEIVGWSDRVSLHKLDFTLEFAAGEVVPESPFITFEIL